MDVLECKVCFENYESICRKPRSLGCGHTFCSVCLEDMLCKGIIGCPGCRKPICATTLDDFPVNYSIMELLEVVEHKGDISPASLSETLVMAPQTSAGVCEEHGHHLVFYCTTCGQWICRDCTIVDHQESKNHPVVSIRAALARKKMDSLKEFDSTDSLREKHSIVLKGYLDQLKTGTVMLGKISDHIKTVKNFNLEEQDRVKQALAQDEHFHLEILAAKQKFTDALTFEEVTDAVSRTSSCQKSYEKWISNDCKLLMAVEDRNNILKWLITMMYTAEARQFEIRHPFMYAVQEVKGGLRSAAITQQDGLLHLHSLKDGLPPDNVITLPYSDVHELIKVSKALIFLDLQWDNGNSGGKIYIRLGEEYSHRAYNFFLLCTGEQGPSYYNSHFHQIYWIGRSGEYIECGDYEKKDGTGGAPLLEGLEYDGKLKQPIVCGTVSAKSRHKATASMFKIYTKDSPGYFDKGTFGCVEKGMGILRKATAIKNIQGIEIKDCGVIIPMVK